MPYLAAGRVAVLGVLLVLGVEVVDGVRHDVPGVHRLPDTVQPSINQSSHSH